MDQQPTTKSYSIPKGVTVRWHNDNKVKLCEILSCQEKNNTRTCKVKVLGSNNTITLPQSSVELVCAPDPSSIPESISDIDNKALQDSLSHEDMKKIWDNTDTTYSEDEKLFLYWHMRLRHKPQKHTTQTDLRNRPQIQTSETDLRIRPQI